MLCSWANCSWSVASSLFLVIKTTFTRIIRSILPKFTSRTAQCNTTDSKEAGTPSKPYITLQLAFSADVHTGTHTLPQSGFIILFRFQTVWKNLPWIPYIQKILAEVKNIINSQFSKPYFHMHSKEARVPAQWNSYFAAQTGCQEYKNWV